MIRSKPEVQEKGRSPGGASRGAARSNLLAAAGVGAAVGLVLTGAFVAVSRGLRAGSARKPPPAGNFPGRLPTSTLSAPVGNLPSTAGNNVAAVPPALNAPEPATGANMPAMKPVPEIPVDKFRPVLHAARPAKQPEHPVARLAWEGERRGVARFVGVSLADAAGGVPLLAGYREGEDFAAASVIKVPVMLAVEEKIALTGSRDPRITTWMGDMIRHSDNDATNELIDWLAEPGARSRSPYFYTPGMEPVNRVLQQVLAAPAPITRLRCKLLPPRRTPVPLNRAAPAEMARLLASISQREAQGDPAGREMLGIMRTTAAAHRRRIPSGIPPEYRARVGNKTGTLSAVVNDVAIVETPDQKRYVLCILMEGVRSKSAAEDLCRRISEVCWNSLAGANGSAAPGLRRPDNTATERTTSKPAPPVIINTPAAKPAAKAPTAGAPVAKAHLAPGPQLPAAAKKPGAPAVAPPEASLPAGAPALEGIGQPMAAPGKKNPPGLAGSPGEPGKGPIQGQGTP